MTVTKAQAMTADEFHYGECTKTIGPRGGVRVSIEVWRRNGRTQTWKTRPDEFRVPIKYGLRGYSNITTTNADEFHTRDECPVLLAERAADAERAARDQAGFAIAAGHDFAESCATANVCRECGAHLEYHQGQPF